MSGFIYDSPATYVLRLDIDIGHTPVEEGYRHVIHSEDLLSEVGEEIEEILGGNRDRQATNGHERHVFQIEGDREELRDKVTALHEYLEERGIVALVTHQLLIPLPFETHVFGRKE